MLLLLPLTVFCIDVGKFSPAEGVTFWIMARPLGAKPAAAEAPAAPDKAAAATAGQGGEAAPSEM